MGQRAAFRRHSRVPAEVLQMRVFLGLKFGLLIGIAIFCLDNAGSQSQTQRLGHIALAVGKQSGIPLLILQLRDCLGFLDPTVALLQIHTNRLLEMPIAVTIDT